MVFVAETLSGLRLLVWFPALQSVEPFVSVFLDLIIVVPALVFLFVLPSARNIRQREVSERALQAARDELEARVRERTAKLAETNQRLHAEEKALRDSEEKYSNLVENAAAGVFIYQNGKFVFVNPRFAEMLEYSREELLRLDPFLAVHPGDREWVREIARRRTQGEGAPAQYECRFVTRAGEMRWVAMLNTLIQHRGAVATLGNVQDVTERKNMESELYQLSARLLTIQEEERRRLARDLHDSLGQMLTGIKYIVEATLDQPWPGERRAAYNQLHSLVPTIQEAVEELRRIVLELRPLSLDDLGLLATMGWYFRELAKTHPEVEVVQRLDVTESDIPHHLRTPMFRILQEATNNAVKHSGASRLEVTIDLSEGRLRLQIRDDGVGFDPGLQRREVGNRGFGLTSMRERTDFSGGRFALSSAPGEGTTLQAEWPLGSGVSE